MVHPPEMGGEGFDSPKSTLLHVGANPTNGSTVGVKFTTNGMYRYEHVKEWLCRFNR